MPDEPVSPARLREWSEAVNRNVVELFNQVRWLVGREDFPEVWKSADETLTSDTALQNDDELFVPVKPNGVYSFKQFVLTNPGASASTGFKFDWTLPAGASLRATAYTIGNVTAGYTEAGGNLSLASSTVHGIVFNGSLVTGGTRGVCQFRWAQNSSVATALTVYGSGYSWMRLRRLN